MAEFAHWSDCAVHNEPMTPNGECDCSGASKARFQRLVDEFTYTLVFNKAAGKWVSLSHDN